jgi:glycosyltransferase involved in cell wall biosynthesis
MRWPSLSVVIYAYNEADNVGPTAHETAEWLATVVEDWEIVLVDDGSSDDTAAHAAAAAEQLNATHAAPVRGTARVVVHRNRPNRGIGGALKTGFGAARCDWITMLPADGQIAAAELGKLLDVVIGDPRIELVTCHFPDRFEQADGLDRKLLSEGLKAVMWTATGVRRRFDGIYLLPRARYADVDVRSESFFFNFELPIRLLRLGIRDGDAALQVRPRRSGASKVRNLRTIRRVAKELIKLGIELRLDAVRRRMGGRAAPRRGAR